MSLFLIGDAGHADRPDHPVISALRAAAGVNPAHSTRSSFSATTPIPWDCPRRMRRVELRPRSG